jgi:hypothetical protein
MPSTAYLTDELYAGSPVVIIDGYRYCIVSKHKTQFNAHRQLRKLDYKGRMRKVGKWWMILQGLPKKYQNGRLW